MLLLNVIFNHIASPFLRLGKANQFSSNHNFDTNAAVNAKLEMLLPRKSHFIHLSAVFPDYTRCRQQCGVIPWSELEYLN